MSKKKILIVEDDSEIRESLQDALEYEGYHVISAIHGKNALDILTGLSKDQLPNLIVLDLMMPVMDGLQFMKTIEADYKGVLDLIPIIVMSAQVSLKIPGNKAPAAIFKKPISLDEFLNRIQTVLNF